MSGGRPFTRAPRLPGRTNPLRPGQVRCPTCEAPPGQACTNATGTVTSHHVSRRRMAARAYNATRTTTPTEES